MQTFSSLSRFDAASWVSRQTIWKIIAFLVDKMIKSNSPLWQKLISFFPCSHIFTAVMIHQRRLEKRIDGQNRCRSGLPKHAHIYKRIHFTAKLFSFCFFLSFSLRRQQHFFWFKHYSSLREEFNLIFFLPNEFLSKCIFFFGKLSDQIKTNVSLYICESWKSLQWKNLQWYLLARDFFLFSRLVWK